MDRILLIVISRAASSYSDALQLIKSREKSKKGRVKETAERLWR